MHVIKLFGIPCIGYMCVTQRKDPEEELLRVCLGASWWQYNDHNPLTSCMLLWHGGSFVEGPWGLS
jgi:hypothetical protein